MDYEKKRILALLMTLFVVSAFTGCAKEQGTTDQTPVQSVENKETDDNKTDETSLNYDKIIVGLDDTFAPMGFRDEKGELTGLDVDLATAVGEVIGIPFELQPIDWSMKETELLNGNIDLIWNGYTITPERQEKVLFSEPYLNNRQVVLVMADSDINTLADLSGKIIAVQAESSAVSAIEAKPEISETFGERVEFKTNNECLMDLEAGRSDAVVADEVLLRYYISQKGADNYRVLDEDFGDEEYGIGARKEDSALINAVNAAIDELKENGKAAEISNKYFGEDIIQ